MIISHSKLTNQGHMQIRMMLVRVYGHSLDVNSRLRPDKPPSREERDLYFDR